MEPLVEDRPFARWLRTGRLPPVRTTDGIELKFNPHHDPHDGRFTSGPGGGGDAKEAAEAEPIVEGQRAEAERGGNSRAFEDPMTLEQAFPGLSGSPAGAAFAVADNLFDFTGPANEATKGLLQDRSDRLSSRSRRSIRPGITTNSFRPTRLVTRSPPSRA